MDQGQDLVKALRRLGYEVSHQTESHIRFTKIVTDILLEPE
ncbi:MAG: type II toxin-antitoxin system HicA family toxin [Planktothrix sp.]